MSDAPEPATRAAPRPAPPAPASGPTAARLLALADQCVQCGLCLPHCPTYRLDRIEAESPRGRIAWAKATTSGLLPPTPAGDRHLDQCLGCRRCEPVCPAGVKYGELLVHARTLQARRRPPAARARAALGLLRRPRLLAALLAAYRVAWPVLPARARVLPRPPASVAAARAPSAPAPAAPAVFIGCIARTYEAPTRAALATLLRAAGAEAAIPAGQGCCGAAAAHAGQADDATALAAANRAAFAGHDTVLCPASGCHDTLARGLGGATRVLDPLAWLATHGAALRFRATSRRVALHLPCTQRSVVGSGAQARELLARIPGLDVVVLADTGCCGAAGLHQITEPARAGRFRAPLLQAFLDSGADTLLSANIGCRLHLGAATTLPVRHPIDFLAEHLA